MNKLPPKPTGSQWTDEQWQAAVADGSDMLVAAAAGSGKTAVLVERIIQKLTRDINPIDIDRLLVVTFTNASAAEMRNRIGEALERELQSLPQSLHLRRQLNLLGKAHISTLHSFCLDVVRKYYYKVDIDPGFRIVDDTEGQLLRDEVIDEMFEQYYQNGNEEFYDLADRYSGDKGDSELQELILKVYDYSRSLPFPNIWLNSLTNSYRVDENLRIDDLPYISDVKKQILMQLKGAKEMLLAAYNMCLLPAGPAPRAEQILIEQPIIESAITALEQEDWEAVYTKMQASFPTTKPIRGDFDKSLKDSVDDLRKRAKGIFDDIQNNYFGRRPDLLLTDLQSMEQPVHMLVTCVKDFSERYSALKAEKAIVDFSDLEHYTLSIFNENTTEDSTALIPSDIAQTYRTKFTEVLVDEYQDTNQVQESILQLVTKDEEATGNMFMVGDVKQAIYRFRLAEPMLFLRKYKRFSHQGSSSTGLKIDLNKNFRSREQVLSSTNFIFKQIMNETVAEIDYNSDAELKLGFIDYPTNEDMKSELLLIDKNGSDGSADDSTVEDLMDVETAQLEARVMAQKIKHLIDSKFPIYDRKSKATRPIQYRDIVILLRSMPWASQIMEEFKEFHIPIYAQLSTGYFDAVEVGVMLELLRVIDNPQQDIPLAAVLRSPIVGLSEEDLAYMRIHNKRGNLYEAMAQFVEAHGYERAELAESISYFYERLQTWRSLAREGSLTDLIWKLYEDTGYYDFVGGLINGKQRQANLRALYDRAHQYEQTSFRGLFRFLRFIEKMRERGNDLGTAKSLGEQEDVVRLMTIHSSKGLEFPVVFVAGLNRKFNTQDLGNTYLLDKELGFGTKVINPTLRIMYPSLIQLAIKHRMKQELIAEEMRVLYVALTRAKEKLYLVGTIDKLDKTVSRWQSISSHNKWALPSHELSNASSYLDWVGPAVTRHQTARSLHAEVMNVNSDIYEYPCSWQVSTISKEQLQKADQLELDLEQNRLEFIKQQKTVPINESLLDEVKARLDWRYEYPMAVQHRSKQTVSEIKRAHESMDEYSASSLLQATSAPVLADRPRFMQEKTLTAAERGTAMHTVMQHIDLLQCVTKSSIEKQVFLMVERELLTSEQAEVIDIDKIVSFFETSIGQRLLRAPLVKREVPFSMSVPAKMAYPDWQGEETELVLVQGVMDCVFEDDEGLVLLDYKTDAIYGRFKDWDEAKAVMLDRYKLQIQLYRQALSHVWGNAPTHCYLYFFDGDSHLLEL
ncbi:helicase-exonuclease AddAB subunit AddA [Bacillus sp. HMF5848]|uniref:helicase-exonuclease AddAB subunit AddA n=1 Tax=Bacillus sp. HMF5848 TaxID=2495421 RepID=UPI000F77E28F|nr:helicase-exonuclease AddAB subunit AddA [Bacillus sp. HMF5848]RSK26356.1 helicase-exonuclease AddAB subunit AddA [Bacillus sp. HMF5848]